MHKLPAAARARKIKLLLFDVDGVLTDGKLFIFPAPAGMQQSALDQRTRDQLAKHSGQGGFGFQSPASTGQNLIEAKGFHAHDGTSISLARLAGIKTGLITKRISETVALRARDLKLEYVRQGVSDKRTCFEEVVSEAGIKPDEAAFVGDDIIDLPAMRAAGLAIAVKNARAEVRHEAHYVTPNAGGDGALRDAVEFILKAQGKWKKIVEAYIGERSPKGSRQLSAVSRQQNQKSR
jgi:3-deoxy-D-manno-octulosonate 8-phosphate phosphatase (KDO 8-P phosphatase)